MRSTVKELRGKKMTIAQVIYINNKCIVTKLSYILQVSKLSKRTINNIQSPILRLAKNKLEIARTVGMSIILYRNQENCNSLWNHL